MQIRRRAAVMLPVAAAAALPAARALAARAEARRPNVLWVVTDDQSRATLPHMPAVGRQVVGRGTRFDHGYCAVPLCGPARVSILTGRYPHTHGCTSNSAYQEMAALGLDSDTVATRMAAAGYRTGYFGKYLNGHRTDPTYVAPGWHRWVATLSTAGQDVCVDGRPRHVEEHVDAFASRKMERWLRRRATGAPWFAVFAPTNPHSDGGGGYNPSPEHRHDFDGVPWDPPALNEIDLQDKPSWRQGSRFRSPDRMRRAWEGKLEELQDVDDQVRSVLRLLRRTRQMGRTYVFFISDNGYLLGEHRLFKKDEPYEESSGIPFVVRGPTVPEGTVSEQLVSQVDLMPTTLEIAGVDPDADGELDGRSMLPHWRSGDWSTWRRRLLVEHPRRAWAMLREGPRVLVDHHDAGEQELYDFVQDPWQMESLHAQTDTAEMTQRLTAMRKASGRALRALEG